MKNPFQTIRGVAARSLATGCVAIAITFSATSGNATLLNPGSGAVPVPLELDPVAGTVVASQTSFFTGTDGFGTTNFTGSLVTTVLAGDPLNPFGGLTFTYLLSNDPTSSINDPFERLTLSRFDGFLTDVSYNLLFGGVVPTSMERSLSSAGRQIAFEYDTPFRIQPGQSSALLVVQTDALYWQLGSASVIDNAVASALILAPSLVVPEPSILTLALCGAGLLIARRRLVR
jgi:hypothetical protein